MGEPVGVCPLNELGSVSVPFEKPSTYFFEETCTTTMEGQDWALKDAIYSCNALPICSMTCGGPNKNTLKFITKKCSCNAEFLGHSVWLQVTLALTVYITLNMSRIGFVQGLSKLLVKYLHPGLFTFKGTCDRDGNLLLGEDFAEGESIEDPQRSNSFQTVLREKLAVLIPKFKRMGLPMMIAAISMNLPWFWLLSNVSKNVVLSAR